jgi:fructose-1,6-bisphosphatase I/sedoheptulose-1,7-bisphosphatase
MHLGRTTLPKFLAEQLRGTPGAGELVSVIMDVASAVKAVSAMVARGALGGSLDALASANASGDTQKLLDVTTNTAFLRHCEWSGLVAGMVSEEMDVAYDIPEPYERGPFLLVFDPLDGSSNIDINVSVGSIFSILRHAGSESPVVSDYLKPGTQQVAAGYAMYGPSTLLVLTVGRGTHAFTLDREVGDFILTQPDLQVPAETSEFAINASNERFWEPPVQRYVSECKAGTNGIRVRDFNMRWIASMVAEVHRILVRGGVFMYPRDTKTPLRPGRLRLLYEASPMAMLVEQAGGAATTGRQRILDVIPTELHQRLPVILGSRNEIERLERYHREYDSGEDRPYVSPLFNDRSLYRTEGAR